MIIRISFEDCASDATQKTLETFYGIPSGTCLTSSNAVPLYSTKIRKLKGLSVGFWYLDVLILNKHYGGVLKALSDLLSYPGVESVDILDVEKNPNRLYNNEFNELQEYLLKYLDGSVPK